MAQSPRETVKECYLDKVRYGGSSSTLEEIESRY